MAIHPSTCMYLCVCLKRAAVHFLISLFTAKQTHTAHQDTSADNQRVCLTIVTLWISVLFRSSANLLLFVCNFVYVYFCIFSLLFCLFHILTLTYIVMCAHICFRTIIIIVIWKFVCVCVSICMFILLLNLLKNGIADGGE